MRPVLAPLLAVLALLLGHAPATGGTSPAISPALQGPVLTTPAAQLREAVRCDERASRGNERQTVVLVHGTGSTPRESFSWGYVRALRADGFGVCTVQLPRFGLGSFTRSAEYVVHAVRVAHRLSGRRVSIVGHSQGGSMGLWVTKYWPDVRRAVDDVVSIAGPLRGTQFANLLCAPGRCVPLAWELSRGSAHMRAQTRGPLPQGPSYTSLVSRHDEVVFPQPLVGSLPGVRTYVTQDICPADPAEHGLILGDPLVYRLTVDALTHRGPASRARLPADRCREAFIPHGDLAASYVFGDTLLRFATGLTDPRRMTAAEPRLPAYAR